MISFMPQFGSMLRFFLTALIRSMDRQPRNIFTSIIEDQLQLTITAVFSWQKCSILLEKPFPRHFAPILREKAMLNLSRFYEYTNRNSNRQGTR